MPLRQDVAEHEHNGETDDTVRRCALTRMHLPKEDLTMALAWNDDRVTDDVIPRSMLIVALDAVR